jgi:hypothetical protein
MNKEAQEYKSQAEAYKTVIDDIIDRVAPGLSGKDMFDIKENVSLLVQRVIDERDALRKQIIEARKEGGK